MIQSNHETPPHAESSMHAAEFPAYLQDELASLAPAALADLLVRDEDRAPRMLIDECACRGDAMVEHLAAAIDQDRYWIDEGGYLESWLPLHATMILGLVPTERAGLLLVSLMRRMTRAQDHDLQDWLAGYWPAFFRNKPEAVVPALRELALDRQVEWYMRSLAEEVVIAATERVGTAALESELDWAAAMAADETEDWHLRLCIGGTLLDFPRDGYRALLERLADRQSRAERHFSRDEIAEAYAAREDDPQWRRFENPWKFYEPDEIAARQERWAREDAEMLDSMGKGSFEESALPYVRQTAKVGRNDPCPCGSGKKYKKCCLPEMED